MHKVTLFNIKISQGSENQILEEVMQRVEKSGKSSDAFYIVTPNPEMIVKAQQDKLFRSALNGAYVGLPDGTGIALAAKILGIQGISQITGVDFMDRLCQDASKKGVSVGFLGGRRRVAERTAECLLEKYPGLEVVFVGEEWGNSGFVRARRIKDKGLSVGETGNGDKEPKIINPKSLIMSQIDILFVAFGFPKQELWMAEHSGKLPVKMMMGVGGAFDYISGDLRRAPKFVRRLGLEWMFRLVSQPWRFRRQLSLVTFIILVLGYRLGLSKSSPEF